MHLEPHRTLEPLAPLSRSAGEGPGVGVPQGADASFPRFADPRTLLACGLTMIACIAIIAQWDVISYHGNEYVPLWCLELAAYAVAVRCALRGPAPTRATLGVVFVVALVARLLFVPQTPTASDDISRYVWDGRIQAAGINPYAYPPNASVLIGFRDAAIYPGINRKPVRTIYPPMAQAVFRAVYAVVPDSIAWTKLAFVLVDMGTVALLMGLLRRLGRRADLALLYAWHPLVLLEVGHSGHVDAVAVAFFVLALAARIAARPGLSGGQLACATLVKFYALVAAPAFVSVRWRGSVRVVVALAGVAAVSYVPFLAAGANVLGYLPGYAAEEGITTGERYYLLRPLLWASGALPTGTRAAIMGIVVGGYQAVVLLVMAGLAIAMALRPPTAPAQMVGRAAVLFIVLFALTTPSQPWYMLLLLACAPLTEGAVRPAALLTATCAGFGYLHWWLWGAQEWPLLIAYGGRVVAVGLLLHELWAARGAKVESRWSKANATRLLAFFRFPASD